MFYKIIPFLVWYGSYSPQIGLRKVPSLADLYSPGLQAAGYWTYVAGLAATTIAILLGNAAAVTGACALLALSLATLALNVAKILSHLVRPRIEPLNLRPRWEATLDSAHACLARRPAHNTAIEYTLCKPRNSTRL